MRCHRLVIVVVATVLATSAQAQDLKFRGFVDGGSTTFSAQKSFKAILGSESGRVFGGGIEAVERGVFLNLRISRFQKTGQRVFIFQDQQFPLGIPETIRVTPFEVNGGYRFEVVSWLVPYAGGGLGWHRFRDTSKFADSSENFEQTYRGFQLLGGAEFRLSRWLGAAAEAQWSRVPDALGDDPNSISNAFSETDLGGTTLRVKVVIGR